MSQPITWRSVASPNFGSSAALLRSGGDTINQGINSLSGLAKGIAEEQKGIELSNAIAALGKATTDDERRAIFDTQSAQLGSRGIDRKELIAADQARHKTIQDDQAFASNQKTQGLTQAGLGYSNDAQKLNVENLPTQIDLTNQGLRKDLAVKDSSMAVNESSIARNRALNALTSAQAANIGSEKNKEARLRKEAAILYQLTQDPSVIDKDPTTGVETINQGRLLDLAVQRGIDPVGFVGGREVLNKINERDRSDAAAAGDNTAAEKDADRKNTLAVAALRNKAKPLGAAEFEAAADTIANAFTKWRSPIDKIELKGYITALAPIVGQQEAFGIVQDSVGGDNLVDFDLLRKNIARARANNASKESADVVSRINP